MERKHIYTGLTDAQVAQSRAEHGDNILTPPPATPIWKLFLEKFKDPLIIILLVAGLMSMGISVYEYTVLNLGAGVFFEPAGIFIAIILATALGFIFELKADREFAILNKVNDDEPVQVYRNGVAVEIPRKDVVVGDIVVIATGQEIPADGELLDSTSLNVDESTLTGEPLCGKTHLRDHSDKDATYPSWMVLRGTKVMEGHGVMEVTAVGDRSENGKVFEATHIDENIVTPLNRQLSRLSTYITRFSYGVGIAVVAGRILMYFFDGGGESGAFDMLHFIAYLLQTIMIAVALIVVSVPEGLPMAVTLSLAYSMRRLLKSNNLVRKLHACETMGATTVICTDKTGTLTRNRMTVADMHFFITPDNPENLLTIEEGIAVNATATLGEDENGNPTVIGNPTEGALLLWLRGRNVDFQTLKADAEMVAELPFSTERKFMASVVRSKSGKLRLYVKGAPEIVYGLCRKGSSAEETEVADTLRGYQEQGMRTLALAYADLPENTVVNFDAPLPELTLVGIVAISDPVRDDVPDAVAECVQAGIEIKIVTGDTPATAREIGRQIGLWTENDGDGNIITGPEFAKLSDDELLKVVPRLKIIARARPIDKKRLVETLRRLDEVVAVTGDGTNDAPALKAAHVGLSMGDGTSVAKEASDITIIDNSFASIGKAVMWGRSLYVNLQRFISFQLTVNVVACLVVLAGAFMGTESPLTVTQMLWVNLIMDTFAALALSTLPPSHDVMNRKPRQRSEFIITPAMWRNIISTGLIFFVILAGMIFWFERCDINNVADVFSTGIGEEGALTPYELTVIFTVFVMLQFWNIFNSRALDTHRSAFHLSGCGEFLGVALVILIGQILIVTWGGAFFNTVPLSLTDWLIIFFATSPVLLIGEFLRQISPRKRLVK
ncbi:MAG: calcium-translocating P-type ATPase, PMCA-type [Duncaniella sp.]|nr:calcium-translocating P-type ATPase, PMCA-type [Duncaniella sp.]